jgi:hypothetical protein
MRKKLIAAVALAPLSMAAPSALAATQTITSSTTTPIATATASSGSPADIQIGSGGNVSAAANGTASSPLALVTLNSNNSVTNLSGTIASNNFSNVIGILAQGGYAGSVENDATISLGSSYTPSTQADGYSQGPFAGTASPTNTSGTGVYGLYGVRITGSQSLAGNFSLS